MKFKTGPVYLADTYKYKHSTKSIDSNKYKTEEDLILFGGYFFLSNSRTIHIRTVYNIVDILVQVGGIYSALFTVLNIVGRYINIQLYMNFLMT